ncbi:glycosyltransferase family 2 protein [Ligilactobacillus saerimneri]|uniref:glycosyltransferase family 2 protein n=1 Tax=Ligilactobacillus saerimneri TaxID=228229 RepID=UPI0024B1F7C0|nr:glycosyltransferase family A protein [Ligilactobacillus saerimneri]MDI9206694.1 glycosyltransferase family A protein [Ligilactobacillus saerimneri]
MGYKNVMANSKTLLSVIVPIYNSQDYVAAALQSLQEQSFTDFEAILVENQSSDESLAVVQRFAQQDPRLRIVQHETNQGLATARNTGNDSNCPGSDQSG